MRRGTHAIRCVRVRLLHVASARAGERGSGVEPHVVTDSRLATHCDASAASSTAAACSASSVQPCTSRCACADCTADRYSPGGTTGGARGTGASTNHVRGRSIMVLSGTRASMLRHRRVAGRRPSPRMPKPGPAHSPLLLDMTLPSTAYTLMIAYTAWNQCAIFAMICR